MMPSELFKLDITAASLASDREARERQTALDPARGSAVGGEFYNGIEWLACWLLDNAEGETITEEQLRPWAAEAWKAHLTRQNDQS